MSRVTLIDIYNERFNEPSLKLSATADIEVVPRKIVEMIIAKCADHASGPKPSNYIAGVSDEADWIKNYAESLLKQFEED
jgi:hypothetical protein